MANASLAQDRAVRIDPPHWWVGTENPVLELMLFGKALGSATIEIEHPSIRVTRVKPAEDPNYLFVTLDLQQLTAPCELPLIIRHADGHTTQIEYALDAYPTDEPLPIDAKDVIYLITPDRFSNGNQDNDSVQGMHEATNRSDLMGRYGGDIQGIINHVAYLKDLGVTTIWSSPLLVNNQPVASYHGYAITDHYAIDPRMGTLSEYQALSQQLRSNNMKLIMDLVPNHVGSNHWWMDGPPYESWINHGEFKPTNHTRNTLHDPHASNSDLSSFQTGWFVESMPDLNQQDSTLATYLIQNAIWWVMECGLSGYRIDTYSYSDHDFIQRLVCELREEFPDLFIVAEEWTTAHDHIAYWQKGHPRNDQSCLFSLMDFPNQAAVSQAVREEESWNSGLSKLYHSLSLDHHYTHPEDLVVFLDNHDMDRWFRAVDGNIDRWKMGLTWLLTTRGIPQLYYGTEILMNNALAGHHGDIRRPFPGSWVGDTSNSITGEGLHQRQLEAKAFLIEMLHKRASSKAITEGSLIHFIPQNGVYVWFRISEGEKLMVLLNKNEENIVLDMTRFHEQLKDATHSINWENGKRTELNQALPLAPMSSTVLEIH